MLPTNGLLALTLPTAQRLAIGQTSPFRYRRDGFVEQGFVLRRADGFVAFANRCPHWNVDLDLGDEHFYDPRVDRILCKNHGATFLPADGTCDAGPCRGKQLERFVVTSAGEGLIVEIPDAEPA